MNNNNNLKIHKHLNYIVNLIKKFIQKNNRKIFQKRFKKKYKINNFKYGSVIINNIVYNENFHIVALFKDYLISDDLSEFLKLRLPKFYDYYETYSRIYPNYTSLPEAKFIYKNIHKKQKMIDLQKAIRITRN